MFMIRAYNPSDEEVTVKEAVNKNWFGLYDNTFGVSGGLEKDFNITDIKDGSIKIQYGNLSKQEGSNKPMSVTPVLIDADASLYGNGAHGIIVPGADGKYDIRSYNSDENGMIVVNTVEIPE